MFIEEVVVFRNCGKIIDYLACQIGSITSTFAKDSQQTFIHTNAFIKYITIIIIVV